MKKNNIMNKLISILFISTTVFLCAFATFRGEQGTEHANVVSSKTPIDVTKSGTIWSCSFLTSGTTSYNSIPILTEHNIYIANSNILYELDYKGTIKRQITLCKKMNSISNMLLEDHALYIPLSEGTIECIDISTMTSQWTSESFGGQSLSTLFYHEGNLYAGCTNVNSRGTDGIFYCLDALNGSTVWKYRDDEHPGGYYWSGAIVRDNALYFTGDNGILVSHALKTNDVYDTYPLTTKANIRSGITYDKQTNAMYTVSNDGMLYKINTENNKIADVTSTCITKNPVNVNCTSTPTVYQGRIYTGLISNRTGLVSVIDATSMDVIYEVKGNPNMEIKSSPLVSTRGENDGTVYVYVTGNGTPGAIYYFVDTPLSRTSTLQTLFAPAKKQQQFCFSSIVAGKDGTLYYSNDSGSLFAVSDQIESPRATPTEQIQIRPTPLPTIPPKTNKIVIKKPNKLTIKKTKKSVKISWKKQTKNCQTTIFYRYGSGKWKQKIVKTKSTATFKRKKKLRLRLQCRLKKNGKWYYSGYTKTFLVK